MAEKRIVRALLYLLFPPRCAACGQLLPWSPQAPALCAECGKRWDSEKMECCSICANRVGDCLCQPEEMEKAHSKGLCKLVPYSHQSKNAPQNRMIYRLKKVRDKRTPAFLAQELAPQLRHIMEEAQKAEPTAFAVCYVPRGRAAALKYGTDQAKELARAVARELDLPCLSLLQRQKGNAKPQKSLTAAQRVSNVRHAFCVKKGANCANKSLLLADDVVTTGASMAACTRLLRKSGAKDVYGIAIAVDSPNEF